MSFHFVRQDGPHSKFIVTTLDQKGMTMWNSERIIIQHIRLRNSDVHFIGGELSVVATPEVVSDLVTKAEVAYGAGLLGHGECQPIVVCVKVG